MNNIILNYIKKYYETDKNKLININDISEQCDYHYHIKYSVIDTNGDEYIRDIAIRKGIILNEI